MRPCAHKQLRARGLIGEVVIPAPALQSVGTELRGKSDGSVYFKMTDSRPDLGLSTVVVLLFRVSVLDKPSLLIV